MTKIILSNLTTLRKRSKEPIKNMRKLEQLQEKIYGEYRHEYYRFLYHLVNMRKPKVSIEIGVDQGLGSAHIAAGHPSAKTLGIDISDNNLLEGAFEDFHFDFIKNDILQSESHIKNYVKSYGKVGVVFQDTTHEYQQSIDEWNLVGPYLDDNALWVVDDLDYSDDMSKYFDKFLPGKKKKFKTLHEGTVMGVTIV